MKVKTGKVERNIYFEVRGDAVRLSVEVHPLKPSKATFNLNEYEKGVMWARRERVALLEQKAASKAPVAPAAPVIDTGTSPTHLLIKDVLDNYHVNELSKLSGAASDRSRLKRLEAWFGYLTLGELRYRVLDKWMADRKAGLLGSGRSSDRELTKHERHKLKAAGKAVKPLPVVPPSQQTIRHEIILMRRALMAYFREHELLQEHGAWLHSQYIMQIPLPKQADPRDVRVEEDDLAALFKEVEDPAQRAYIGLAIMTTLRRGEMCSLEWEDVDMERKVLTLRAPGHQRKTKIVAREIPLLPPALEILKKYGVKAAGKLFPITPSGISQAVRRAADKAGLHDVRLHDFRREGISRLVETLEASLEEVTVFSGHQDRQTLQKHYVRQRASVVGARLAEHPMAASLFSAT